jgi:hypothetical protein
MTPLKYDFDRGCFVPALSACYQVEMETLMNMFSILGIFKLCMNDIALTHDSVWNGVYFGTYKYANARGSVMTLANAWKHSDLSCKETVWEECCLDEKNEILSSEGAYERGLMRSLHREVILDVLSVWARVLYSFVWEESLYHQALLYTD